jgi:hypothetical protein
MHSRELGRFGSRHPCTPSRSGVRAWNIRSMLCSHTWIPSRLKCRRWRYNGVVMCALMATPTLMFSGRTGRCWDALLPPRLTTTARVLGTTTTTSTGIVAIGTLVPISTTRSWPMGMWNPHPSPSFSFSHSSANHGELESRTGC